MIDWTPYPNGVGSYALVGNLRLVAYEDGAWSVQDLNMKKAAMHSPMKGLRVIREWNLSTAKEQAEQAAKLMAA